MLQVQIPLRTKIVCLALHTNNSVAIVKSIFIIIPLLTEHGPVRSFSASLEASFYLCSEGQEACFCVDIQAASSVCPWSASCLVIHDLLPYWHRSWHGQVKVDLLHQTLQQMIGVAAILQSGMTGRLQFQRHEIHRSIRHVAGSLPYNGCDLHELCCGEPICPQWHLRGPGSLDLKSWTPCGRYHSNQ